MTDLEQFADVVVETMRDALADPLARIAALEKRIAEMSTLVVVPETVGVDVSAPDIDAIAVKAAALIPVPRDGKDAEPADLDVVAAKAAALIPVPQNGLNGRDGADGVKGDRGHAGTDGRDGIDGEDGRDGVDGKDADPAVAAALAVDAVRSLIAEEVVKAMAAVPTPRDGKDGRDGTDGKDADPATVRAEVGKAIAALPVPKDGKDGRDGKDGASLDPDVVAGMVDATVQKAVAARPVAKDGRDGADGKDGRDGIDGVGLAGALIAQDGSLTLTLSNGTVHPLGIVKGEPGRDGKDGADGEDGFSLKDYDERLEDDGRVLVRSYTSSDGMVKEFRHKTAQVIHRGVWEDGRTYERGDQVTWAGSSWIARESTTVKPDMQGPSARAWQLAVKKGRDGKDGPQGPQGPTGVKGDKGDQGPPRW